VLVDVLPRLGTAELMAMLSEEAGEKAQGRALQLLGEMGQGREDGAG